VSFPHEAVPDSAIFGPHHLYVGVLVVLAVVWVVSDNYPHREPLLAAVGALVALFAFATVWPYYPPVGALGALAGLTLAAVGILWPGGIWGAYPLRARGLAVVGVAVALDDVIEHAFPVATPLDVLFARVIYPVIA